MMGTLGYAAKIGRHDPASLEYRLTKEEKFLYDAARGIDRIDPYIGVGTTLLVASDSELLTGIGIAVNVAEAVAFKVPFITRYYLHTRDWKGAGILAAKTALTTFAPGLAWLQLLPANYMVMRNHLSKPSRNAQGTRRRTSSWL